MEREVILRRLDVERRSLQREGRILEAAGSVVRLRAVSGAWHMISFSELGAERADAAIAGQVAWHRERGVEFEWKVYGHDGPGDLLERLKRFGFDIGEREAVMVLALENRPEWMVEKMGHEVIRVKNLAELELYERGCQNIFPDSPWTSVEEIGRMLKRGSRQQVVYVALDAGEPVSVGRLYTHPESAFGGLYGGGTQESHRGRGFYRAVVAARARDAAAWGSRYLQVDALPTSRPILERMGFVEVTGTWPCVWRGSLSSQSSVVSSQG